MAAKVIYFVLNGRQEQVEFCSNDEPEDVHETFRAAAQAGSHDVLKLYDCNGSLINISEHILSNTVNSRYHLEVLVSDNTDEDDPLVTKLSEDLQSIEKRLAKLERKVYLGNGNSLDAITELRTKATLLNQRLEDCLEVSNGMFSTKTFAPKGPHCCGDKMLYSYLHCRNVESVEHLSWLGLFKNMNVGTSQAFLDHRTSCTKTTDRYHQCVFERFTTMSKMHVTPELRELLKKPTFDNWQWDDVEMLFLLQQMFLDLGLVRTFNLQMPVLLRWLFKIYATYNRVPFHNFNHCFMVSQMVYCLIWLMDLHSKLEAMDLLVLLTSAICHDLDHPGYNNSYQINARTVLALRYNDISPLENHHCAVAFEIFKAKDTDLFGHFSREQFKALRDGMIRCILATDMTKHAEILKSFMSILANFDFCVKDHRYILMKILVKMADISNECRPMKVSEPWAECLLQEFFNQGDIEKLEGLPVSSCMDRDRATKTSSQIGFISCILLPFFEAVGQLFPQIDGELVEPIRSALVCYTDMQLSADDRELKDDNVSTKTV